MKLLELLPYENIVIQCHDNPDPDTIAAGYALYCYFKSNNKEVKLIYSGRLPITKPNIIMMIEELKIPIEHIPIQRIQRLKVDGLIITVDCQYGAGNVSFIEAKEVAIIDHHIQEVAVSEKQIIRSELASTSTLVWDLLCHENFDVNEDLDISTALYYGLFTDSSGFAEIYHALDKDMRDSLKYDMQLIRKLKNSIITLRELEIAGMALIRNSYNAAHRYVMVKAQECDPNILGIISDFALQVDCVDVSIVYNEVQEGIRYSVRSCVKEVMANELAVYLSEGIGSGGGHRNRAAGFISYNKYNKSYSSLNTDEYLLRRLTAYYQSFEVIHASDLEVKDEQFKRYKKIPSVIGYVRLHTIVPNETSITIRNQKEDIDIITKEGMILLIDSEGMTYILDEASFKASYKTIEEIFEVNMEYFPKIKIEGSNQLIKLNKYVRKCVLQGEECIKAKVLEKAVKIFEVKESDQYTLGQVGDYLVIDKSGANNLHVIKKEVFDINYLPLE